MQTHTAQTEKLAQVLNLIRADGAIVLSDSARLYLSGMSAYDGAIVITKDAHRYYITDTRYTENAEKLLLPLGYNVRTVDNDSEYAMVLNEIILKEKLSVVLLESDNVSHEKYLALENALYAKVHPLKTQLSKIRMTKSDDEVEKIKIAQRISEISFEQLLPYIKPGVSEKQIQAKLVKLLLENGSDLAQFDIYVQSGENTSLINGLATDRVVGENDIVLLEFGATYQSYRANMARTVAVGTPSDEFRKRYQVVQDACIICQRYMQKGMSCKQADTMIREFIEDNGYRNYPHHSLGHGIGISLHEGPYLSSDSNDVFMAGNVLCMIPGIYIPGKFGIRICDMLYISDSQCENLTRTPHDLIVL